MNSYTHVSFMLNNRSWSVAGASIICISCPVESGEKTLVHFLKRLLLNKEGLRLFHFPVCTVVEFKDTDVCDTILN